MARLLSQLIGLLTDIMVGWLVPLVGAAIFSSLAAILIAANNLVGGGVVLAAAAMLVYYCAKIGAVWQVFVWGVTLGGYGLLALVSPQWALLWGLGISALAMGLLWLVPGAVLPPARRFVTAALIAVGVIHTVLATAIGIGGFVFPIVLGLLVLAMGTYMFSQGARPWEIRSVQRSTGRILSTIGIIAVVAGLAWSILGQVKLPKLSAPAPVFSLWSGLSARIESWALSAQRNLIGERAKTRSLEELSDSLRDAHRERWRRNINLIPSAPLDRGEWKDLGVSDP